MPELPDITVYAECLVRRGGGNPRDATTQPLRGLSLRRPRSLATDAQGPAEDAELEELKLHARGPHRR